MDRIQKILSEYGVCSRREAERLIAAGKVTVNDAVAQLGQRAEPADIKVNGRPLAPRGKRVYIMLNKPRGYVTTTDDEKGRKSVLELVNGCGARVYPVGRLDMASEGLLLLTNDGEVTNRLTHPRYGMEKVYSVTVSGGQAFDACAAMGKGVTWEGVKYLPAKAQVVERTDEKALLEITVHEGKYHEVRNLCASQGLEVRRLVRTGMGSLKLEGVKKGQWRHLTADELEYIRNI